MKIALTVGHSRLKNGNFTSADGRKYGGGIEYCYCKSLAKDYLLKELKKNGHDVDLIICPERKFTSALQEKDYKLNLINKKSYDLLIELHLNAAGSQAEGTETLYASGRGKVYAASIQEQLSTMFKNRGIKKRTDLYILNKTAPPAVLVEIFFCTNSEEWKLGLNNKTKVARLIAAGI